MDNIEIIQIQENLQLNLGYVGGDSVGGIIEETDPVFTANSGIFALKSELFNKDYNELNNKPEIPTKTSDLTNDSNFITTNDIPDETDPIYIADKPNIALKSELFSKSYNDLTDKPDLYTPKADGDGSQFLADDGTYKTVQIDDPVDLSNYIGKVVFFAKNENGEITNTFQVYDGYTAIGIDKTQQIDIAGQYLKWWQYDVKGLQNYSGIDFESAKKFKLPENTKLYSGAKLNLVELPIEMKGLQYVGAPFNADFSSNYPIQKYHKQQAIEDGILNFTFKPSGESIAESQSYTVEVMIPYTSDLTTFVFDDNIQQIQIPESITYNPEYTYNYAVFVVRLMTDCVCVNYSYSFGVN